ncbi:MAG: DUF4381 domain-containing protein [Colwellia sp.]
MNNTAENILPPKDANPALDTLHEISVPADISWFPQTLGWQLLLLAFLCYLLFKLFKRYQRYMNNAYRRAALKELCLNTEEPQDYARLSKVLRKTALYAFDRTQIAPLVGADWELWLDKQAKNSDFSGRFSGLLGQLTYAPATDISPEKLSAFKAHVISWVKNHRGYYG